MLKSYPPQPLCFLLPLPLHSPILMEFHCFTVEPQCQTHKIINVAEEKYILWVRIIIFNFPVLPYIQNIMFYKVTNYEFAKKHDLIS